MTKCMLSEKPVDIKCLLLLSVFLLKQSFCVFHLPAIKISLSVDFECTNAVRGFNNIHVHLITGFAGNMHYVRFEN